MRVAKAFEQPHRRRLVAVLAADQQREIARRLGVRDRIRLDDQLASFDGLADGASEDLAPVHAWVAATLSEFRRS